MSWYFGLQELIPASSPNFAQTNSFTFQSNQSFSGPGVAVGAVQQPTQNEEQTITPPGSGNYYLYFMGQTTTAIAHGATDSQIQAALVALSTIGTGNVSVSSAVVTFQGAMAGYGQPLLTDPTGAATIARTQAGWTQYALAAFNDVVVTAPTTAPTVAASGSAGSLAVGAYTVCYTLVTAGGESTPSYVSTIAVASTNSIVVTSITGLPAQVTAVNVYVNDQLAFVKSVSAGATGTITISALQSSVFPKHPPLTSTAYTNAWGAMTFIGFTQFGPFTTDQFGRISASSVAGMGDQQGSFNASAPVYVCGRFNAADLSGLDATTLAGRGYVEVGSITTGVVRLF